MKIFKRIPSGKSILIPNIQKNYPARGNRAQRFRGACLAFCLLVILSIPTHSPEAGNIENFGSDVLVVSGVVRDAQKKPLKGAALRFFLDGREIGLKGEVTSSTGGRYEAELSLPKGTLTRAKIEIEVCKPSYRKSVSIRE